MVDDLEDPRRQEPGFVLGERAMLEAWLEFHRMTLLIKCEGLDDAGRKARPVPTSKLSLHGLVRHMAEVERNWFRRVLLREPETPPIWYDPAVEDSELVPLDDADWEADLARLAGRVRLESRGSGRPPTGRHRATARQGVLLAVDLRAHDRGVRTPQRPRRPDPRARRRRGRLRSARSSRGRRAVSQVHDRSHARFLGPA